MSESENETIEEQQPSEEHTLPERPGRRLREAREAKNLSRENMAAELRLQPRLVAALEEDDYSSMPPPAFVIGYLRSYARRLDLPADEIVRAYEQSLEDHQPEIISRVKDSQVSSRDLPVRMVTWLIFIGLGALLVVWWLAQQPAPEEPGVDTEIGMAESENTPTGPEQEVEPAPDLQESETETAPEPAGMAAEPEEEVSEELTPEVQPQAEVQQPQAEEEPQSVAQQEWTGVNLRMEFQADSWVQVTDAGGEQLVSEVIEAGRTLRFEGQPPFRVILGYARGVSVYYQGERFDYTPYLRGKVARFIIGSADDVQGTED